MTTPSNRLNAALAGRYRIERELGAGGMATVYLAEDLKHDRKVAIKVLKPELAAVLGAERFVVEIKTTAAMSHPHILPLFDSGTADGFLFYVMPYIQGETIREKLNRETQFGVDEAVRIAREVADALDYAHRHGVIHRDIKPENILLHDGRAMVMDFGIALAVSAAAGGRMTETGLSLGTPHYMSPEQATAEKEITARSDQYSLASVLYEMLAGQPPHIGGAAQQVIMRIITEPARRVSEFRKNVPPNVNAALAKALEKLPADRFDGAKAFADALANDAFANAARHGAGSAQPDRGHRRMRDVAFALAGTVVMAAAWYITRPAQGSIPSVVRFTVELPDSVQLIPGVVRNVALSQDGARLAVLCGTNPLTWRGICVRRLDESLVQPVRGTDGARSVVFSPDGQELLFDITGALKKVSVAGGTATTVAAENVVWSSWTDPRSIVFSTDGYRASWVVPTDGGDRRLLAKADTTANVLYENIEILPGGRDALVILWDTRAAQVDSARIGLMSLKDGTITDLHVRGVSARYAAPGRILFVRSTGQLFSAPFSLGKRAVTGAPVAVAERIGLRTTGETSYTVSQNGVLMFVEGNSDAQQSMYIVDRQGREALLPGGVQGYGEPRVSPDGKRIAVRIGPGPVGGGLWIYDLAAGTLKRLTGDSSSIRGEWTRDGKRIVYVDHATTESEQVVSRAWDSSDLPTVLAGPSRPYSFYEVALGPPNGTSVIRRGNLANSQLMLAPTESLAAVRPLARGTPSVVSPQVSPHGRLLAYTSNESGRFEVFVRPIPGPGAVKVVSVGGGTEPSWGDDESTLYYRGSTRMMVATVVERPALDVTRRDSLFVDTYRRYTQHSAYDVFPGGREFVMTRGPKQEARVTVIANWPRLESRASVPHP